MSLSLSEMRLRKLDLQSYKQRFGTWAREVPTPSDVRIKNVVTFEAAAVKTDGRGNITGRPLLLGKPCFGIPTAFLRHGRSPAVYVPRRKEWIHNSRCDRCKVKDGCLNIIRERLSVTAQQNSDARDYIREWAGHGGFDKGGFGKALSTAPHATWDRLTHLLALSDFSDSNREPVEREWRKLEEAAHLERARHARLALRRAWLNGDELGLLINGLNEGRQERAKILSAAINASDTPGYLDRIPNGSVERISFVWWGRELARFTGRKLNPNSIARCMIDQQMSLGKSANVLRDAVKQDLERIDRLESKRSYNRGVPVWPKFVHPSLQGKQAGPVPPHS